MENLKIAILIPCRLRPEYTKLCLESLETAQKYSKNTTFYLYDDGSNDQTQELLVQSKLNKVVIINKETVGLRNVILDFFSKTQGYDIISKIDNDCTVPKNWLQDIVDIMKREQLDIVSPNVFPSNAAYKYGKSGEKPDVRRTSQIGGVWTMLRHLADDIYFERIPTHGITGAFPILHRIVLEKEPKMAWLPTVTFQDIGHWSGSHPKHIKTLEHEQYSAEVRRAVAWQAS